MLRSADDHFIFGASFKYCLTILLVHLSFPLIALADTPQKLPLTLNNDSANFTAAATPQYVIIQPSDVVTFSSETGASILKLNVREGSPFQQGDVLLQMDCRLQQAELDKASAQLQSSTLAYQSALKLKKFGSISELEEVKAKSDALMAKAEVDKYASVVDKCIIKAPFTGAVSELMVHPFETVKPGDPLLRIVNTQNLEFEVQIPSKWLDWLKIGDAFNVKINETNKTVTAKVTRIDPQIESISQTIKITGTIPHPDKTLLPGMSGQAIFTTNPDLNEAKR